LEAKYGTIPQTVTVRTGGGGLHYYFRLPDFETYIPSSAFNRIGYAGIDFLSEGKGAFAPPGIHKRDSGEYRYEPGFAPWETEFTPLSDWLLELTQSIQDAKPKAILVDTDALLFGIQSREEDTDTYITGGEEREYSLYVCDSDAKMEERIADLQAKWMSTEFELGTSWGLVGYLIFDMVQHGISVEASEKAVGAVISDHAHLWKCRRPVTQFRNDVLNGYREVMKRNPPDFGRVTRRPVDIEIPEIRIERLKQLPPHQMLLLYFIEVLGRFRVSGWFYLSYEFCRDWIEANDQSLPSTRMVQDFFKKAVRMKHRWLVDKVSAAYGVKQREPDDPLPFRRATSYRLNLETPGPLVKAADVEKVFNIVSLEPFLRDHRVQNPRF